MLINPNLNIVFYLGTTAKKQPVFTNIAKQDGRGLKNVQSDETMYLMIIYTYLYN